MKPVQYKSIRTYMACGGWICKELLVVVRLRKRCQAVNYFLKITQVDIAKGFIR
ncbi:MAG: hypothetical protein JWP57_3583 [Spirosoma sp.]|nr:hypothetical protein [Spirosoma sp.]